MAMKSAMNIVGTEHILAEQLSGLTSISQCAFNIVYPFCPLAFYAVNGHFRFHFLIIINSIPMATNVQIFIQDFSLICFWPIPKSMAVRSYGWSIFRACHFPLIARVSVLQTVHKCPSYKQCTSVHNKNREPVS